MKKLLSILLVLAMLLSALPMTLFAAEPTSETKNSTYYSYADIVKRTYDMSYLATEPKPGEGGKEVTSTDPASKYNEATGKYENWGGNADNSNYVRINPDNGYRVLADLEGPGYLNHLWTGNRWDGNLHIWIDGELVIDMPFIDFVNGNALSEYDQLSFQANYVDIPGFADGYHGAVHQMVPITYNESCQVEIDLDARSTFYYMVGYYDLEDGASVESFQWPMSEANRAALKQANDILNDNSVPVGNKSFNETVAVGETVTLYEGSTAGAITGTSLKLGIPEAEFDDQTSLTQWVMAMYWDGSTTPAVCMPVGDFYGTPYGLYDNEFDNAGYGVAADGTMYSTWYMPYNTAKITLTNNSDTARSVSAGFAVEELTSAQANTLTRFHANWQRSVAREDDRNPDAQMLSVEGKGRYVGTNLHVYQIIDGIWWGEGDEKFFIDGEKFPTWYGTGSEDYFGYAWCGSQIFDFAYVGQTHNDGYPSTGAKQVQGHGDKVNYRLHVEDNVCFNTSLETNIEKFFDETVDKYAATTYFYLTRDTSENHAAVAPTADERLFNNNLLDGAATFYPGAYLNYRRISSNTSVEPWLQPMGDYATDTQSWYGNVHLFWPITAKGKAMEFLLELPESGNYALNASLTTAPDYGIFDFYIDDELVGSADGYGSIAQINPTLGFISLNAGAHILRIECAGKNLKSGGYVLGLNYLEFVPAETAQVKHFFGGTDYLAAHCTAYTGEQPVSYAMGHFTTETQPYRWHNDGEMFWNAGADGVADFELDITQNGTYEMELAYTLAQDFATFDVSIDGELIAENVNGCRGGGVFGERRDYYNVELTKGKHTLTITSKGKSVASTGYLIGIDYISLNTQKNVGAFYGGYNDLKAAAIAEQTTAELNTQELGWLALNVWYHNMQLLFNAQDKQATFAIELPAEGDYTMSLDYTTAGDFATFELYLDGEKVAGPIDGYAASAGLKTFTSDSLQLSAGAHTLSIKGAGKNAASTGYLVGISCVSFTAPYQDSSVATGETLTAAQQAACDELESYAEEALTGADTLQTPYVKKAMAEGMVAICKAEPEQVAAQLAAAKTAIDTVLQTTYEEELEIDIFDDLFFEGGEMPAWVTSYSSNNAPNGQGLDPNVWSLGGHLFWMADKVGDTMELTLKVPYTATYEPELCYTTAGDYCQYDLYIDNKKLASIDSYGSVGVKTISLEELTLSAGEHTLKAVITGKNDASPAYALGIDHIVMRGDTVLAQVQKASKDYLKEYKQQKNYSNVQWNAILACVLDYSAKIDAAATYDAVLALWREGKAALDAIESGLLDFDTIVYDSSKTPGSFGWQTDGSDFGAWQTTSDGQVFFVDYEGAHSKRIWKNLIEDPENFTLTLRTKVGDLRASIEVMGAVIELNAEHGNGSQLFDKESWSWFNAEQQICNVTIARANGGNLSVKLLGMGNTTPVVFSKGVSNPSDTNVYLGVIDNGGSAAFADIAVSGVEAQSVQDFGWDTDEIAGEKDFSGWTTIDGVNITASFAKTTGNHRIWKNYITDQNNFSLYMSVDGDNLSSGYVKLLGQILELDGRGGDGNQLGVKLNGSFQDWVYADNAVADVYLTRKNGGDIVVNILGKGGDSLLTRSMTPSEENENLELGIYEGTVSFNDLGTDSGIMPFVKAVFAGDNMAALQKELIADITEYQSRAFTAVTTAVSAEAIAAQKPDLLVIADGSEALLSGKSATAYAAELKAVITAVKAGSVNEITVLVAGLPYLAEATAADIAAYNAAIKTVADETDALYADLYAASSGAAWTVAEDGRSMTAVGSSLAEGELLKTLMRACPCLAVNTSEILKLKAIEVPALTAEALNAFKSASDAASIRAAIENGSLGLSLSLYHGLRAQVQSKVLDAVLAADRSDIATHTEANVLFLQKTMEINAANPCTTLDKAPFATYVAVGDSITEGYGALHTEDNWVNTFGDLLSAAQGSKVTTLNKGISGTRMCSDIGTYPAAKDTVQQYIVANDPDILTISYGINDFHAGTGFETFISTYRQYLTEVKAGCPDTVVLVFGLGAKGNNDESSTDLLRWNAAIKALAEEFGFIYNETYYDLRGVEWLLLDGLHPNNAGYRMMANTALRALNTVVPLRGETVKEYSPADFDWETDEDNFSGWTATDAENMTAVYAQTANNHRVWKNLLTNQEDFLASADITVNANSSAYIKALGVTVELDGRHGDGNQAFIKLNGQNKDWVAGADGRMHVVISRENGGELQITVTGKGNDEPMSLTATATESNENLELGLYAGKAIYENISVKLNTPEPCEHDWQLDAEKSVAATCTEDGKNVYTCSKCEETKTETVEALGHDWGEGVITTAPTLTEKGVLTYTCTRCDATRTEEIPEITMPFTDVPEGKWYTDAVAYAYVNKLMAGTSETTFNPDGNMTRAMLVTVLWRLNGETPAKAANSFTDVPSGQWYTEAVSWAAENKLVSGIGNGKFDPTGNVTREQIAVFVFNYAKYKQLDTSKTANLTTFPDSGKVSAWAKDALSWANAEGLISGTTVSGITYLAPKGNATRSQVAAILMRYVKNIVNAD